MKRDSDFADLSFDDRLAGWVERIGRVEGYSWLVLLFLAMPLKYGAGLPVAVRVAGSLHGGLFVAFVVVLALAHFRLRWGIGRSVPLFLTALLPFGFLAAPRWLPARTVRST